MVYMEKGTMTGQALHYLSDKSLTPSQGARPGVPKVCIVFTDGRSQDYIGEAAKKAKDNGKRDRNSFYHCPVIFIRPVLNHFLSLHFLFTRGCGTSADVVIFIVLHHSVNINQ